MKKTISLVLLTLVILGTTAGTTLARDVIVGTGEATNPPASLRLDSNNGLNNPNDVFGDSGIFNRIIDWIFAIFMTVAVIFILLAAFTYLTSKGGEEVGSAHKMLLWASVAIAVALLAKGFINVVRILVTNKA